MTKAERQHLAKLANMPCIVCRAYPVQVHHILSGGRRIDHFHTLPLCFPHHQAGLNNDRIASRHPWKREFEKRYGKEMELLAKVRAQL